MYIIDIAVVTVTTKSCPGYNSATVRCFKLLLVWPLYGTSVDETSYCDLNCIPGLKSRILRSRYTHAAAAEIFFWMR